MKLVENVCFRLLFEIEGRIYLVLKPKMQKTDKNDTHIENDDDERIYSSTCFVNVGGFSSYNKFNEKYSVSEKGKCIAGLF